LRFCNNGASERPAFLAEISSLNRYIGKRHCADPEMVIDRDNGPVNGGIRKSGKKDVTRRQTRLMYFLATDILETIGKVDKIYLSIKDRVFDWC